eukprot:COSAG02_NODE_44772_length_363_cov_0.708333_1_plen_40_part_10
MPPHTECIPRAKLPTTAGTHRYARAIDVLYRRLRNVFTGT